MPNTSYENNLITKIGFIPKENTTNIYQKKYSNHDNYSIEVDFKNNTIDYGGEIVFNDTKNTLQNITKSEDLVVLECVDKLLTQDYTPKNIILEKVYPSGHGTSGRLDILVTRDDASAYMMVECKTWGKEFNKAFAKLNKDGGQLFTYFQQDKDADVLVLYASQLNGIEIEYTNQIIKIEEEYRATSNVKDLYDRWNKTPKNNGVFNSWCEAYDYKSKALTPKELIEITSEDSSKIFNRFMEILRHNVVSDKPNAFSKIFTLFLCKIMDEKDTKPNEELDFQWIEGKDTHISFQKRLTDLYQKGMKEFLDKEVTDLSDAEFEEKFGDLDNSLKEKLLEEFTKIRLQKNNEFAIKDVFDQDTFEENAIVVKEVVELLQNFQIRYTKKQQFLSDFFELLLTTGLKQEVGQFFTPVPVAKFIIRSIPFDKIIQNKLSKGVKDELLPNVIDYAVGSGHFITEAMDEIQKYINNTNHDDYISDTVRKLKSWREDHFDWAYDYVYGIEKDYRLVKTAKVGCYLHGDGLAKVIHGDGLSSFTDTKEFKGKLSKRDKNYYQDNKQFDLVISNPPYSVSAFKNISRKFNEDDFELYEKLTDQSSEIETLFIERTKQLLKDGGIAGIILPSSILSNSGIYTKTREIIFKYFDIVSITELGSNTFMATGTNTVVLFLRRKNNADHTNIKVSVDKLFESKKDITINGVENPLQKYINHVWEDISLDDYLTLLEKNPNDKIKNHELYQEYDKKLGDIDKIIILENEKLFYFISAYPQKVTLVKTGEKKDEKKFLGYEFSARRGSEGIHPIQRGKTIDECTSLYDETSYTNSLKANSYIYSAFNGELKDIDESLEENISYVDLVNMMTFDRVDFEKSISLNVKKKVIIESKYPYEKIDNIFLEIKNGKNVNQIDIKGKYRVSRIETIADAKFDINATKWTNDSVSKNDFLQKGDILFSHINSVAHLGKTAFFNLDDKVVHGVNLLRFRANTSVIIPKYISEVFKLKDFIVEIKKYAQKAANQASLNVNNIKNLKVPLPPKNIQEKIVQEIEATENKKQNINSEIVILKEQIFKLISKKQIIGKISDLCEVSKEKVNPQNDKKKKFYYLGLEHIESNTGKVPYKNIEIGNNIQSTKNIFKKGNILYGKLRPYLNKVTLIDFDGICSTDILVLKSNTPIILKYILLSNDFVEKTSLLMRGVSLPRIKIESFLNINISYPPVEEHKKIVSQIEVTEKNIEKKEQQLANIPQQKEDILNKYLN